MEQQQMEADAKEQREEEPPMRYYFGCVRCFMPWEQETVDEMFSGSTLEELRVQREEIRRYRPGFIRLTRGKRSPEEAEYVPMPPGYYGPIINFLSGNQDDAVPLPEEAEVQQMPRTLSDLIKSPLPQTFLPSTPYYQPVRRSINDIGATKDEANAKSVSHNNLDMPSKRRKQDGEFKVLKPISGNIAER